MSVRGIDTQMLATKPTEMTGNQMKINKQAETQMAQNASEINKNAELDRDRTIGATGAEGKKIGTEERERGNGASGGREHEENGQENEPEKEKWVDPMLSLPVEKGRYAKSEKHYIDIEV